jgi:hypothetical protein
VISRSLALAVDRAVKNMLRRVLGKVPGISDF